MKHALESTKARMARIRYIIVTSLTLKKMQYCNVVRGFDEKLRPGACILDGTGGNHHKLVWAPKDYQ